MRTALGYVRVSTDEQAERGRHTPVWAWYRFATDGQKTARQDRRSRNYSSEHWRSSRTRVGRMGNTLRDFVSRLRVVAAVQTLGGLPDRELLGRFVESNDESAFSVLVERHGAMVLAVCRRLLPLHGAEDAFQAVFMVLARPRESTEHAGRALASSYSRRTYSSYYLF